jgi:Raf kinase inhibitor-like YbhB/YbcL family protein
MKLMSTAFQHNSPIPALYTCDGRDVNPPLAITDVPSGAKSLALIVDDPDAPRGTWVHWVLWNIDPATSTIPEHSIPPGASEGVNDFKKQHYGGPCPPSGTHRYFFKLYALDRTLDLKSITTAAMLETAMKGHVLAEHALIGLYSRR